ncbi:MAG: hypothetical protein EOP00_25090 [Pedobacter sp.]|nr:MAG: hypothetical protein EOP00_25090 [Pedobacter sp.]
MSSIRTFSIKRAVFVFIAVYCLFSVKTFAEGSKDLYPSGVAGNRAVIYSSTDAGTAGAAFPFVTQGTHYAYVMAGESITASSSSQNVNGGRVRLTAPDGSVYNSAGNDIGRIWIRPLLGAMPNR